MAFYRKKWTKLWSNRVRINAPGPSSRERESILIILAALWPDTSDRKKFNVVEVCFYRGRILTRSLVCFRHTAISSNVKIRWNVSIAYVVCCYSATDSPKISKIFTNKWTIL